MGMSTPCSKRHENNIASYIIRCGEIIFIPIMPPTRTFASLIALINHHVISRLLRWKRCYWSWNSPLTYGSRRRRRGLNSWTRHRLVPINQELGAGKRITSTEGARHPRPLDFDNVSVIRHDRDYCFSNPRQHKVSRSFVHWMAYKTTI